MPAPGRHHQDLVLGLDLALHHPHQRYHTQVVVEPGIDDQRLQLVGIARLRWRNALDNGLQNRFHVEAGLRADCHGIVGVNTDDRLDLLFCPLDVRGGKVDLVEHGNYGQSLLHRRVAIGHGLRFHALGRIHHQQGTFTGSQRAADFVGKVHMPGGIDEVQLVRLAVPRGVGQRDTLRLDGDSTLAFDRVGIQDLGGHFPLLQATAQLDDAVGKRGFAVVYMGNDREVSYVVHRKRRWCRSSDRHKTAIIADCARIGCAAASGTCPS